MHVEAKTTEDADLPCHTYRRAEYECPRQFAGIKGERRKEPRSQFILDGRKRRKTISWFYKIMPSRDSLRERRLRKYFTFFNAIARTSAADAGAFFALSASRSSSL